MSQVRGFSFFSQQMTFDDLPVELKLLIFLNMPIKTQAIARNVCKDWREILNIHLTQVANYAQRKETIHEIMKKKVLNYLDNREMIAARSVCQLWNNIFLQDLTVTQKLREGQIKHLKSRLECLNLKINEKEHEARNERMSGIAMTVCSAICSIPLAILAALVTVSALAIIYSIAKDDSASTLNDKVYYYGASLGGFTAIVLTFGFRATQTLIEIISASKILNELKAERIQILKSLSELEPQYGDINETGLDHISERTPLLINEIEDIEAQVSLRKS